MNIAVAAGAAGAAVLGAMVHFAVLVEHGHSVGVLRSMVFGLSALDARNEQHSAAYSLGSRRCVVVREQPLQAYNRRLLHLARMSRQY